MLQNTQQYYNLGKPQAVLLSSRSPPPACTIIGAFNPSWESIPVNTHVFRLMTQVYNTMQARAAPMDRGSYRSINPLSTPVHVTARTSDYKYPR